MSTPIHSIISGSGCYLPTNKVLNNSFLNHDFYVSKGVPLEKENQEVVSKFLEITTIVERRHATGDLLTSDIAYFAALDAIESSKTDIESFDYIIVAHNFGDIKHDNNRSDIVPSIAARVKHKLGIENPNTVAYDIIFGCPGWLQGIIQADYYLRSGDAKKALVIGADILSRVCDPNDRDSMLYADGAGAVIIEANTSKESIGLLAHLTRSDTLNHSEMLFMGKSFNATNEDIYLKMNGRKLYQYALETVPQAIQSCLQKCNIHLSEVSTVLIHQANGKMDDAILRRLYDLYDISDIPEHIMPMTISWLGNSSVATLPTLLDLMLKNKINVPQIESGQILVFASVGAGMNINAMVYKVP
jgi:3-oxoacyl-[acyl-carrier-protein] synthase III